MTMIKNAFRLSIDNQKIARLIFDVPNEKVNTFSLPILQELEQILNDLSKNKEISALAISSAKDNVFIAGADLHSFETMFTQPSTGEDVIKMGNRVFNKLSALPFPSFALIHGACLGGGLEFALACTYRIVSDHPKTVLGLPEVTLGIIPGWGGTQRLPRLVGLLEGLPMVLGGKPIKGFKAWKIKLADSIATTEFFQNKADQFIEYCLTEAGKKEILKKRQRKGIRSFLLEKNPLGRNFIFRQAKQDILNKTKGQYPAPLIALKLIKETYSLPLQTGLHQEAQTFIKSISNGDFSNAQHLINLFFIQETLKKESFVVGDVKPIKVDSAGVIGAGTMGGGIAWLFSNKDIPVRMKDIDWAAVGKGYGAAHTIYNKLIKEKKLKSNEASMKFHCISGSIDYSGFKNVGLVVEAATENLELKHKILRELEQVISKETIVGSNTSSLTISQMGEALQHPERFIGMHFFNPANRMPLVEIVASPKSSPQAILSAVDICRKLGKTPIVVADCPGFLVNRILISGLNELLRIYEEGANPAELEKMMSDFGMPMSPFVLADEVGNDVSFKVGKTFEQAYGARMTMPRIIPILNEHKLFGKKCGKGFYVYNGEHKKHFNPELEALRKNLIKSKITPTKEEMRDRVFLSMINEASRCLKEKIVAKPEYLDAALILGIGFPPFRGGLLRYADSLGTSYIVDKLKRLQEDAGDRFAPSELLLDMQKTHQPFYKVK